MEKYQRISWEPKYTVHDEELDRQHRKLFEITNKLINNYESGVDECFDTLKELVGYLSEHFKSEQLVMMKINYWAYDRHEKEHKQFIDKVQEFIGAYQKGQQNLTVDILKFLRDWIFSHTTSLDLKYGELLQISKRSK